MNGLFDIYPVHLNSSPLPVAFSWRELRIRTMSRPKPAVDALHPSWPDSAQQIDAFKRAVDVHIASATALITLVNLSQEASSIVQARFSALIFLTIFSFVYDYSTPALPSFLYEHSERNAGTWIRWIDHRLRHAFDEPEKISSGYLGPLRSRSPDSLQGQALALLSRVLYVAREKTVADEDNSHFTAAENKILLVILLDLEKPEGWRILQPFALDEFESLLQYSLFPALSSIPWRLRTWPEKLEKALSLVVRKFQKNADGC